MGLHAATVHSPSSYAPSSDNHSATRWDRFKTHFRLLKKWWLRPQTPFQPLFLIATCRSGSNLLLSYLNQQSGIATWGEVLCSWLPIGPSSDRLPPAKAISHIRLCLHAKVEPIRGCKLMLHQLSNCGLTLADLNREFPSAKYIVLYRQSLAEQFVSQKVAEKTVQFMLRPGQSRRQAEIQIDPSELRQYCDDVRRQYREALSFPWLQDKAVLLSYEELVANPNLWLKEKICPLVNIPFAPVENQLVKQNTRPLSDQIINYREVAVQMHSPLCRQQHTWPVQRIERRAA
jgi:LPS sulfotransferase NodH